MTLFLLGLLLVPGLIGLLVIWHVARPQRSPADTSNRINKIRLLWFALTREELFADVFPWLRRDEHDNITKGEVQ
jgi:hypothetical protein